MVSNFGRSVLIALLVAGFAGAAQAAPLQYAETTLDNCDAMGCDGSTLFLSVQEEVGGTWLVTYTINTDNYTGSLAGFNQIGFKAIADWSTGTVISSPAGSVDDWNPVFEAPINSNSLCDNTNGNSSKVCIWGFVDVTAGGNYTWEIRLDGGTLITDEWHLGAQYANGPWRSAGHIISASARPIPEPTAALLFGMGALLVTRSAMRRR
jgi:hypothetical protein